MVESDRVNVKLIPKSAAALDACTTATGLGKTDVVNRALQLYAFVLEQEAKGSKLCVLDKDRNVESIRLA